MIIFKHSRPCLNNNTLARYIFKMEDMRGATTPRPGYWTKFSENQAAYQYRQHQNGVSLAALGSETSGDELPGSLEHSPAYSVLPACPLPSTQSPMGRDSSSVSSPSLDPHEASELDSGDWEPSKDIPLERRRDFAVCIPKSTLVNPKSCFDAFLPPRPPVSEGRALRALMSSIQQQSNPDEEDFIELELDQFSVYIKSKAYPSEFRPLQHLATKVAHDTCYFDGVLRSGGDEHYVRGVSFNELPIGNYGILHASVDDQIWIRSHVNRKREVYYKLKNPAPEYAKFHGPFLWLADLSKHVVDFCSVQAREKGRPVTLWHFQKDFINWLDNLHGSSPDFQRWRSQYPGGDYRRAVVANVEFIWKEVHGVLGFLTANSLAVFKEIKLFTRYPTSTPLLDHENTIPPTIVTPYIHSCFGHMKLGNLLEPITPFNDTPTPGVEPEPRAPEPEPEPELKPVHGTPEEVLNPITSDIIVPRERPPPPRRLAGIKPGDVISTYPDGEETGTKWKRETIGALDGNDRWFGLVQKIHTAKSGSRSFDVIWLYHPADTPCCRMKYPWGNELFLSDHCTCLEGARARWTEDEVLAKHSVQWFGRPEQKTAAEYFVRQTYMVEGRRWVTLDQKHMKCDHSKIPPIPYRRGDTVLAKISAKTSEPYEVLRIMTAGSSSTLLELRPLFRRANVDPSAKDVPPNELVYSYTAEPVIVKVGNITGRCLVRVFSAGEPVITPYDRRGTGNAFYITHKLENLDGKNVCWPFKTGEGASLSMKQGFDPRRTVKKLRGLDLFCGSGNFGRGLEEGGVVEMECANDICGKAMHTYMANTRANTQPFLGSVDDFIRQHLEGNISRRAFDFIAGGSPCPGFSLLTNDKTCDRQLKNQSFVASFASCVDFFRPKYGVLENVPNIVQLGKKRMEDVFSQLICAIVGMGYQVQVVLGDAWSYGAPQNRTRVFLYFAAPGYRLPEPPLPSHSHHAAVTSRSLGVMSNGEPYVRRPFAPTAFKFVSAAEGTIDVPEIYDGKADCCVPFPDHRLQIGVTPLLRNQMNTIPTHPHGSSFATAWNGGAGVMTPAERELFPPSSSLRVASFSKGWGRIRPGDVFPTITTHCAPTDSRIGRLLHWTEPRPITILEARRAQGFPDHEVLLGMLPYQWKLVGNSVSRHVSLALGLQFREALLGSLYEDPVAVNPVAGTQPTERSIINAPLRSDKDEAQSRTPNLSPSAREESGDLIEDCIFSSTGSRSTSATSGSETPEKVIVHKKRALSFLIAEGMRLSKAQKVTDTTTTAKS